MQVFMKILKTADSLLHSCPTLHIVKFVPVLEVTHIDMQGFINTSKTEVTNFK